LSSTLKGEAQHSLVRILRFVLCSAAAAGLGSGVASGQTKLLRFPDIHRDKVVLTYAGDLWTAPSSGGTATRLTAHPGLELFAKFSPDGKWIAFTGQYDGDEQAYVVPTTGGVPKQLTFYPACGPFPPGWGYDNQVYGWTPDGKSVSFRSLREGWDHSDSRIYTVPVAGGLGEPLPMPISGGADLSPDGKQVVYTPFARDFRTWKRYQGGWAQDLWIFDLATQAAKKITDTPRTERDPMWIGNKIYFASDRTGTLNLYSYDLASGGRGRDAGVRQVVLRPDPQGRADCRRPQQRRRLHLADAPRAPGAPSVGS
jgi:tricorn protease